MQHARLDQRLGPHGGDRLREAFQSVADHDARIDHAAVLDLGSGKATNGSSRRSATRTHLVGVSEPVPDRYGEDDR